MLVCMYVGHLRELLHVELFHRVCVWEVPEARGAWLGASLAEPAAIATGHLRRCLILWHCSSHYFLFFQCSHVKVDTKVRATSFLPSESQCYFNELGVLYR
jgi:hypothetical protein